MKRYLHSMGCEYPEGCSCGASEHNNLVDRLERAEEVIQKLNESNRIGREILEKKNKALRAASAQLSGCLIMVPATLKEPAAWKENNLKIGMYGLSEQMVSDLDKAASLL